MYSRAYWATLLILISSEAIGLCATFTSLQSFSGPNGRQPSQRLTAVRNQLYGTTDIGSDYNSGLIFRYDISSRQISALHSFGSYPPADGFLVLPFTLVGSKLYAPASYGGLTNHGVLLSIDTDTGQFSKLLDFGSPQAVDERPFGTLTQVGSSLYGVTRETEGNVRGTIYRFDLESGGLSTIHTFAGATLVSNPNNTLVQVGSLLYGTSYTGGQYGAGCIYSFDLASGQVDVHYSLEPEPGKAYLRGNLLRVGESIYGTTGSDGALFKLDITTNEVTMLHAFTGADGREATGSMVHFASSIFGVTSSGGQFGKGTVFKFDTLTNSFSTVHHFSGFDGSTPYGGLNRVGSTLYGTTYLGGQSNYGTIFSIEIPEPSTILLGLISAGLLMRRNTGLNRCP
jgi:uncharacterized repeat protein (TIGR03803 family)